MPFKTNGATCRNERPIVVRALHSLRADDHLGAPALEELEGAPVEVDVAEVDLVGR